MTTTKKILIDAGHSGTLDGWYYTPGKRSPQIPPGYYEGEKNREIAGGLVARLRHDGISAFFINSGVMEVPEASKVKYHKAAGREFGIDNVICISLHNNASPRPGWDETARGATVFTNRLTTRSDAIALAALNAWCSGTGLHNRGLRKAGFTVLAAPLSFLLELSFMTSRADVATINQQYDKGTAALAEVLKAWANS